MMMTRMTATGLLAAFASAVVHVERQAEIDAVNRAQSLWFAAPNARFGALAPGASANQLGVKPLEGEALAELEERGVMHAFERTLNVSELPKAFDSAEAWPECKKVIDDIRDQSNCGCCWAFAGAEAASDRMCIASGGRMLLPLSAEDVCFNANLNGCNGGAISTPWTFLKTVGVVTGGQYNQTGPFSDLELCADFTLPHCHHHGPQGDDPYPAEGEPGCEPQHSPRGPKRCDADADKPHDEFRADKYSHDGKTEVARGEESIMEMIFKGGPVETAFNVFSDFENYAGGIYKHVEGGPAGGHAVKMVGWGVEDGVKYWKVANSWNPHWGESGYFRILKGTNECGIEDEVVGSAAKATWSKRADTDTALI